MIYSNACAYAIRAMSRLASLQPEGYVLLDELCNGDNLPRHFVAKIFQDLVRQGLLVSAKGRGGGFALARNAEDISLIQIVEAVDGAEHLDACVVGIEPCTDHQPCPQHDGWVGMREQLRDYLAGTSLGAMAREVRSKLERLEKTGAAAGAAARQPKRRVRRGNGAAPSRG